MKKIDKIISVNLYCIKCKKKQTNYDPDFPLNIPNENFDKDSWSESEVHCQNENCNSQEFYVKKVIDKISMLKKIEGKEIKKKISENLNGELSEEYEQIKKEGLTVKDVLRK